MLRSINWPDNGRVKAWVPPLLIEQSSSPFDPTIAVTYGNPFARPIGPVELACLTRWRGGRAHAIVISAEGERLP